MIDRDAVPPGGPRSSAQSSRVRELEEEARYTRERYQLYRAKAMGPRATSVARLRELERASERARGTADRARITDARSHRGSPLA